MDWLHAAILALVQGFTEFLPISSSAHLILPSQILGWPDQGLAFDVVVHVGTLLAIVMYFRKDVVELITAWLRQVSGKGASQQSSLAWMIVLATIPAGLAGILLNDFVSEHLRSAWVIATTTVVFGLLLWVADVNGARRAGIAELGFGHAFLIGLAQAVALIPGTSRSGITMTMALLLGYQRDTAARFSFLLSIPIIAAAGLLKGKDLLESGIAIDWGAIAIGFVLSFISALVCIHWFLNILNRMGFAPFVIYRLLLGGVLFSLLLI